MTRAYQRRRFFHRATPTRVRSEFKRAAAPEAAIVTHKSQILGVRDGAVAFPLRTEVSAIAAGAPTMHILNVYTSMDLLVLCTWLGMDGQASCNCLFVIAVALQETVRRA
jgi:hypothetical protein